MTQQTAVQEVTTKAVRRVNILDNAVAIKLTLNSFGGIKRVSGQEITVNADKTLLRTTKKLLSSDELDSIRTFDGKVRAYIHTTCLPSFLSEGMHFVPLLLSTAS